MAMLFFAPREIFSASSGPPSSGDWVVTGTENYIDEVIVLNGNLVVEDGGSLTFRNVTLQSNCTSDNHYSITIQTGGEFYVLEGSIITSADSANGYSFIVGLDSTFRMSYSELHYCGWDSPDWHLTGLYIFSDDAVVENCLISNNFFGIRFQSSVVIRNNNITENKGSGIAGGGEGTNSEIYGNHVSMNNGAGISIGGCNASVYNNTVTSNSWAGINPHDEANPMIQNNTVMKNGGAGIFCVFNSTPTISNNVIAENLENGIVCHSYSSSTIVNNTITSNLGWGGGIKCSEYSNPLIQGNTITNNTGGIGSGDFCAPTILDNNISRNNGHGISLVYSNATIQNNVISLNDGGIESDNSTLTVEGNFISTQKGGSDIGYRFSGGVIRGNTFTSSDANCIDLYWSSPIIQGNNLTNNTGTGIWCTYRSNPTIQGNIITFNGGYAIGCDGGSRPEIHQNDIYGQNNYGLCNEDDSVTVNATYNYWGSENGPALGPERDAVDPEEINGSVLFNPWLTESIIVADITDPLQGETVSSTVKISVNARAENGVSVVEFYIDLQLKCSDYDPPYEWDWDTTQCAEASHEIMVKLIDNFYAFAAHASRTVFVDNTSPTASIKEPLSGNTYKGSVTINVNATDNREVSNVHFKVDTGTWLVMTYNSTDFLWKYDLNTTSLPDGQHTLMVLALDKAGNPATTSIPLLIDNNPPKLTIQSPASGMTVGLTLIVGVQANDASNISRIEFYLQDVLVYTVYNAPYQWSWDTRNYPNGDHTITVKAYDNAENVKTSETTVTVKNVELPWWQEHSWTIIQVSVAIGGLILAVLTYIARKREGKKKEAHPNEELSKSACARARILTTILCVY
jgi:parallel beta-helix repeat protein